MKRKTRQVVAFAGAAIMLVVGLHVPKAASAQDLSSQINTGINSAINQAHTEWNMFVQEASGALPAGSSLPGTSAPQQVGAWNPQAPAPVGNGQNGEIQVAGRSYLIWVPHGYNPARPTPVMVGYSAYQDSPETFRDYSHLRESSVGRNAIIVYPRAIGASWEGSPTASTRPGEDIAFVRAMIDDLQRYYNIDRRRIYATGMSTGGGMAAVSACHMADLFAGVAAVSGAYYAPVNQGCQNLPIAFMAIHGTDDGVTPYQGAIRRGQRVMPVQEMFASYERRNGCRGGVTSLPIRLNATNISARGCMKGVEVIKVHGANHHWWQDRFAADEIWAFLSRHSK